jgi:putative endonuclease
LKRERRYYVYVMASRSLNLYTGVTDDIFRRALEHKSGTNEGFTKKYNINRLVYFQTFRYIGNAIAREKQIKAWTRAKRIALIKSMNPTWQDSAEGWGEKRELQISRSARDDNREDDRARERGFRRLPLGNKIDAAETVGAPISVAHKNSIHNFPAKD